MKKVQGTRCKKETRSKGKKETRKYTANHSLSFLAFLCLVPCAFLVPSLYLVPCTLYLIFVSNQLYDNKY